MSHQNSHHHEADDLWIGHHLSKDPHGIQEALSKTENAFTQGCKQLNTGKILMTANWCRSIADAMDDLVERADKYERKRL